MVESLETIVSKTNFSNKTSECSQSNCFTISSKNIGFTLINNTINNPIISAEAFLINDSFIFNYPSNSLSSSSSLLSLSSSNFKSSFVLNKTVPGVSTISFIIMNNNLFTELNQFYYPLSYTSSLTLRDSTNKIINSSDVLLDIIFQSNNLINNQLLCGYWDVNSLIWSTKGCSLFSTLKSDQYQCRCNHTTFFALLGGGTGASVNNEISLVFVLAASISIFFGTIICIFFGIKIFKMDSISYQLLPAYYSTISSFLVSIAYILASLFMIGIVFNKQSVYSTGCGFLVFLEHFTLLLYFFWLMIIIISYYLTNTFKIDLFRRFFKLTSIILSIIPFLISIVIFFMSLSSSIQVYEINNSM